MKIFYLIFLISFFGCVNNTSKNQIDDKVLDLITDDFSYEEPSKLQRFIQYEPNIGESLEKKYHYTELNNQFRLIQKRLKERQQSPAEVRSNLTSFYNQIDTILGKIKPPVLDEIFRTINLYDAIKSIKDTSDYDVVRFKTALFFHHTTLFINSSFSYHPRFDCDNPSVFSTDTINKNDPVTFFFGHVYTDKNCTIFIDKINDEEVSISFPSDSKVGISSITIDQLIAGTNTISGYFYAPSQPDSKYDFKRPFERTIYVNKNLP